MSSTQNFGDPLWQSITASAGKRPCSPEEYADRMTSLRNVLVGLGGPRLLPPPEYGENDSTDQWLNFALTGYSHDEQVPPEKRYDWGIYRYLTQLDSFGRSWHLGVSDGQTDGKYKWCGQQSASMSVTYAHAQKSKRCAPFETVSEIMSAMEQFISAFKADHAYFSESIFREWVMRADKEDQKLNGYCDLIRNLGIVTYLSQQLLEHLKLPAAVERVPCKVADGEFVVLRHESFDANHPDHVSLGREMIREFRKMSERLRREPNPLSERREI